MSSSANRQPPRWSEDGTKLTIHFSSRRHEHGGPAYEGNHGTWLLYADQIGVRISSRGRYHAGGMTIRFMDANNQFIDYDQWLVEWEDKLEKELSKTRKWHEPEIKAEDFGLLIKVSLSIWPKLVSPLHCPIHVKLCCESSPVEPQLSRSTSRHCCAVYHLVRSGEEDGVGGSGDWMLEELCVPSFKI
jgi:hypothetical protein